MKEIKVYRDRGSVDITYVEAFEKQYGICFPIEYKKMITAHNAVRLERDHFDYDLDGEKRGADISFLGYGSGIDDYLCIHRLQQGNEYSEEGLIVFGETAGGDYVCFDYRANSDTKSPPVVVMLHDHQDENNKMVVCEVASDFESFIDGLYEYEFE